MESPNPTVHRNCGVSGNHGSAQSEGMTSDKGLEGSTSEGGGGVCGVGVQPTDQN